ncbi:phosphoribosylformylglycinamidine cyclo-ligase [Leptospira perolatii]|uniref:Phosphoribosylformylglycinamidine cyclo-ligase n=1 Tax=Leptospira perolatii TaxID=2023191 RepID=A0A2M9ZN36_9LEPT|nr:phosphoribosylformylglycinamidine cyclo-ligase [Leptospira perolatii]PJZ68927.1 phosphoribosylformylglycinamidine cyclo-ligase [Leptospira perolatii]PJZ73455.1 phosphoribosylformylglycinamidine cyclo-ligase [Leptospira perolatii]
MDEKITYKSAGVDTEAGQEFVKRIKENVESTHSPRVLGGLGGFSAGFDVSFLKNYRDPVLLSGTDGVGTKLELARLLEVHDTVGVDLVAMCVNDILVSGGEPLFFLDYIACGKLDPAKMEKIVSGIVRGCRLSGTSLIGGETAEHPGLMAEDEYDLAGFVVGVVERDEMIDGSKIVPGDIVLGLESSGPHSNGFSLIRKLFLDEGKKLPSDSSLVEFLKEFAMKPTRIYVPSILNLVKRTEVKGMIHITGGGYYENIPRVLPKNCSVRIEKSAIPSLPFYEKIRQLYPRLAENELFSTFNMGIGFIVIVSKESESSAIQYLEELGENVRKIGEVTSRKDQSVEII